MSISPIYEFDHLCSDAIEKNARIYKDKTAVVCDDQKLSWFELNALTNQVANGLLELGLVKGDKVCMLMPNSLNAFIIFWGAIKAGCVIVPFNVMLDDASLVRLINASDGVIIFTDDSTIDRVESIRSQLTHIKADHYYTFGKSKQGWHSGEAFVGSSGTEKPEVSISPDDSMTIIYTSGTTGTPKGIEHSHFGRLNYPYAFGAGLGVNRYSVSICATPIYASGTWITMFPALYFGGKIVLMSKFTPEGFLEAVHKEGGTHSFMVPAQYISILQCKPEKYETSSLQVLVSAGQIMNLATREQLAEAFPDAGIYEVYGMTEGFFTLALPQDFEEKRMGTVGKPGFFEDIRILDDDNNVLPAGQTGEIVAYGPGMMKGYYARPDLTEETIWQDSTGRTFLRSGDLGYLDDEGFLYIAGRKKDMIKSGGINIYASDIEEILMRHPEVKEVAVIGVPHPRWSETPVATLVMKDNATTSEEDLRSWANDQLAKYQRLSKVIFLDDFPRATYGKIKKDELRDTYNGLFS